MLVQAENQALRAELANYVQRWKLVPDGAASTIEALTQTELQDHVAQGHKATQLSCNGNVTFVYVMTAPTMSGAPRSTTTDLTGQGTVSACVKMIRSGIRNELAEDPKGLDQLALLSMTQSAIGATDAPYDCVRQRRAAIKAEGERLAAMALKPWYAEMYNPREPRTEEEQPFAGFPSLRRLFQGPMINSVGAGIYLATKHDVVQGQKRELLADPRAQHLCNALKRAQGELGIVETHAPPNKRAKGAAAAPKAGAADDTISTTSSSSSTAPPPTKRTKTNDGAGARPLIPRTKAGAKLTTDMLWPVAYNKLLDAPNNAPAYFWAHPPNSVVYAKGFVKSLIPEGYDSQVAFLLGITVPLRARAAKASWVLNQGQRRLFARDAVEHKVTSKPNGTTFTRPTARNFELYARKPAHKA